MGAKGTISAEKIWNIGNLEEEAWKTEWLIDYIDLNRKVLGAHYSIAGGGPMCAGGVAVINSPILAEKKLGIRLLRPFRPPPHLVKVNGPPSSTLATGKNYI